MNIFSAFTSPEYLFRPAQIFRRFTYELRDARNQYETVQLPWDSAIRVLSQESLGSCIRRVGIHDLITSECIWRLLEEGEMAVDVGANIGHMTSLMAVRAGSHGKVIAVEPHPALYGELEYNVSNWRTPANAAIFTHRNALSDRSGTGHLLIPSEFESNRGLSSVATTENAPAPDQRFVEITTRTLDDLVGPGETVGVLKIDVEGHELHVLQGAPDLLQRGAIRDIVFEDHDAPPTSVMSFLQGEGFTIFHLDRSLLGPILAPIGAPYTRKVHDAPNYLATRNPARAIDRLAPRGWGVYSIGPLSFRRI